ncbi:MAG: SUMF1/EgtB/PvdO family nonheme iron enzyme [Sphingosinicella sp.]|nr:SUMF1/EgtB/PvdO family nonheme iron enzyme [Sphingosinicella sp.]
MSSSPIRTTSTYKVSHALTGPYLAPPGRLMGWPFQEMGRWRVDVDGDCDEWVRGFTEWRTEHLIRIGFDDSLYRDPGLEWAQRNFVHVLTMVEDRYFYDAESGRYTVDRYLDDLEGRFGQVDSVLIWYIYPNIGIDDRSQFDLARDLPGGVEGLKGVVDDFHRRGVKVFLPTMPWDNGTRPGSKPDWELMADLVAATGADGVNGDTYSGVPRAFHKACLAQGRPVVLQPETTSQAGDHILSWNVQSWSKRIPDEPVPAVLKLKWLEPRHIVNIENRWSRSRTNDLQHAFFNGIGYVAWENVFGFWNQLTERDGQTLRRVAAIQRHFWKLVTSPGWRPYERTLQFGIFASRFPGERQILWTLINRNEFDVAGEQISIPHVEGAEYFDPWNGTGLDPRIEGDRAVISMSIDAKGFGAVLQCSDGAQDDDLKTFLDQMRGLAKNPLDSFSSTWHSAAQRLVPIQANKAHGSVPEGMIAIPATDFDFDVHGVVIEGYAAEGVDVQYPWETAPRRHHRHRIRIDPFGIDRCPVTNGQYKAFLDASGYAPADAHNFLRHWSDGAPPAGSEKKPVIWVSIEDARAFAAWAGKRLPREWEWQYAAQGNDGRLYPWGGEWNPEAVPEPSLDRNMPDPARVGAHPLGASPFGVMDMVGNVWQWTDEYLDEHVRAAVLRGGSNYQPQTSHWYFPQAYALNEHGKYLLMAPSKDRSAGIGFRCAADL